MLNKLTSTIPLLALSFISAACVSDTGPITAGDESNVGAFNGKCPGSCSEDEWHEEEDNENECEMKKLEIDVKLDLAAHASLGLLDKHCGLITLGAQLDARAKAKAQFDGHKILVLDVDLDDLEVYLGSCKCEPLINLDVCVAASIELDIEASFAACHNYCKGQNDCMNKCNKPGNRIKAMVELDAFVRAELDLFGISVLKGKVLDLDSVIVVDTNGLSVL